MTVSRMLVVAVLTLTIPCAPANDQWKQLFNGKDLTGWQHVGPGQMVVEDGMIRTAGHKNEMGLLWYTGGKIGNATIRVVYRTEHKADNSGVFIRIPIEPREAMMPVHYGYEVQIEYDPERYEEGDYHATGSLYSLTKVPSRPAKPGPQWNTMEITLDGLRTIVVVNGVKVTDYKEGDPVPPRVRDYEPLRGPRPVEGYIGIQNEGEDVVYFKQIAVRNLKSVKQ